MAPIALIMTKLRIAVRFIIFPLPQASYHFLMTRIDYRLFAALTLSLALHLLPLWPDIDFSRSMAPSATSMRAELQPPPSVAPPLTLPEKQPAASRPPGQTPNPPTGRAQKSAAQPAKSWPRAVREHLKELDEAGLYYPAEAIALGQEGEVLVLLVVDADGKVGAARVEKSSGHELLDAAALRAVRSLRALPLDAPRQVLLPVRFRLR